MMKKVCLLLCVLFLFVACSSSEERSVEYTQKAIAYYEQGKYDEAVIEARNAIKLDKNAAEAYLVLANCSVKEQDWRKAFGAYNTAVNLDPSLTEAQLGVGRLYLLSRQYDKAEERARIVLDTDPENAEAHLLRAGVLLQTGDMDGAQRILTAVLAKHPDNADAVLGLSTAFERKGDKAAAKQTLKQGLATSPNSTVLLFKAGSMAEAEKDYAAAEKYYLRLLDVTDKKTPVQLMIARLYEHSGQDEKAEAVMLEQIAAHPENLDFRLALAGFHLRHKRFDKSMAAIESAESDGLKDIKLELAKADILVAEGKAQEAAELLPSIADRYPQHPLAATAMSKLGALYLSKKDFKSALAALDDAAGRSPSPEILFLRGQARLGTGDVEGAIADLQIVRKEMPDNYQARYLLARAYFAQDKGLMAVEELHDTLALNADYAPSRNLLVRYYSRYGQWDAAEEELGILLKKTPDDPSLLLALGDVKRMRGDLPAAKEAYQSVLGLPEGHGPALLRLGLLAEGDKDYDAAIGYYDKLLELHPKSAAGIERKLVALFSSGDTAALETFRSQLLAEDADSPILHDMFGRLAMMRKDRDTAEKEFRKASELAPDWSVPYQRLIGLYMANNETDKVVRECRNVLAKNPDAFVEEFMLGQIYQMRGENDAAVQAYESVLKKQPKFLPAANNLAYLLAETSTDEATLNRALDLAKLAAEKDNPEALDTLGWLYHLLGNREQSIETLNRAYEKIPDNKTVAYHLAVVLAKWSHNVEARRVVEAALKDGKDFPERAKLEKLLESL
ncbi:MAG: tetratricopeptide repeat protein [Desulfovibrionaceae bacterium]|nr:tetratricopeptide repeat protein [Desulfovibrionaceae bacterium]